MTPPKHEEAAAALRNQGDALDDTLPLGQDAQHPLIGHDAHIILPIPPGLGFQSPLLSAALVEVEQQTARRRQG